MSQQDLIKPVEQSTSNQSSNPQGIWGRVSGALQSWMRPAQQEKIYDIRKLPDAKPWKCREIWSALVERNEIDLLVDQVLDYLANGPDQRAKPVALRFAVEHLRDASKVDSIGKLDAETLLPLRQELVRAISNSPPGNNADRAEVILKFIHLLDDEGKDRVSRLTLNSFFEDDRCACSEFETFVNSPSRKDVISDDVVQSKCTGLLFSEKPLTAGQFGSIASTLDSLTCEKVQDPWRVLAQAGKRDLSPLKTNSVPDINSAPEVLPFRYRQLWDLLDQHAKSGEPHELKCLFDSLVATLNTVESRKLRRITMEVLSDQMTQLVADLNETDTHSLWRLLSEGSPDFLDQMPVTKQTSAAVDATIPAAKLKTMLGGCEDEVQNAIESLAQIDDEISNAQSKSTTDVDSNERLNTLSDKLASQVLRASQGLVELEDRKKQLLHMQIRIDRIGKSEEGVESADSGTK